MRAHFLDSKNVLAHFFNYQIVLAQKKMTTINFFLCSHIFEIKTLCSHICKIKKLCEHNFGKCFFLVSFDSKACVSMLRRNGARVAQHAGWERASIYQHHIWPFCHELLFKILLICFRLAYPHLTGEMWFLHTHLVKARSF